MELIQHVYPAPFECRALDTQRGELERLRDRRSYATIDTDHDMAAYEAAEDAFHNAAVAFVELENTHMAETGCRDRH